MKHVPVLFIFVILISLLTGCNLPISQPDDDTPAATTDTPFPVTAVVPTETEVAVTPPAPETQPAVETPPVVENPPADAFSLDALKNSTYRLENHNAQVTLNNGLYEDENLRTQLVEPAGFGDLNGDGLEDAVVTLATKTGGTGTFYDLIALINQNGTLAQSGTAYFGDRQIVNDLSIRGGRVILDYITQGIKDPSCCPNERRLRSYLLEDGTLVLASEQVLESPTAQATPLPNAIIIEQPVFGDTYAAPQMVRGRVSQVPPDSTLEYFVTDLSAVLLMEGEVPVEGEPGGPGSFAFEFTLESVSPGLIQIEIVDAADGILHGRSVAVLGVQ